MRPHSYPFELREGSREVGSGKHSTFYCEVVKKSGSVVAAGEGSTPAGARQRLAANLPLALWTREDIEQFLAQH